MHQFIDRLYDAAPYIGKFQGTVFVIKAGGEVLLDHRSVADFRRQLLVLWQLGVRPVVVHGGGPQLDDALRAIGHEPRKVNGRRITDQLTMDLAKREFRGAANLALVAALSQNGMPAVGLSGADGGLLIVKRRPPVEINGETVDFGYVGDPVRVNPAILTTLINSHFIPVVCSLGVDAMGEILNVNADTVAMELAVATRASKLIFVTDRPGILHDQKDDTSIYSVLSAADAERLSNEGIIDGGMKPKVEAGIAALRRGVPQVHVLGIREPNALLEETFTNQGCGTMLVLDKANEQTA